MDSSENSIAGLEEAILDRRELAVALGRGVNYVSAMRAAGYQFKYRKTTTLSHAVAWLKENYRFRTTDYYRGRSRPPGNVPGAIKA